MTAKPGTAAESTPEPVEAREHFIRRVIDAPARLLFEAFSKPEHVKRWFGPVGYPLTLCEMDFRVGGRWRFQMTGPDGVPGPVFGGEYLAIEPHRKISYSNAFEEPGAFGLLGTDKTIMTYSYVEERGRTTLTIHTVFATVALKKQHLGLGYVVGSNSALDQLVVVAADLARA